MLTVAVIAAYVVALVPIFSGGQVTISLSEAINKTKLYLKIVPIATATMISASIVVAVHKNKLGDIAGQYDLYRCKEAAKAMTAYLLKKGLEGRIIHLRSIIPNQYIYCDSKQQTISENGNHYGIIFQDTVYCNIHPEGLSLEMWLSDFHSRDGLSYHYHFLSWDWGVCF